MVVTVRHLENNIWNTFQCDNTVSSAPVVRLRDQDRCDPSVLSGGSMETRATNHPNTNEKVNISSSPWINDTEEKVKKDKKWSIGKLFRRKKKEAESESSSTEESSHRSDKKKSNKRRCSVNKQQAQNGTDQSQRSQSVTKFTKKEYFDEGVLSDPSAGFIGYTGRGLPRSPFDRLHKTSRESLDKRGPESSCGSQDGSLRKGRKGRLKARVEAIRNMKNDSSSDEESQKSTSSSILRFRSDDSLVNHSKTESVSKRTRSARTDRYLKRLSRDEETNKDSEILNRLLNRADSESFSSRQRILSSPQVNGISYDDHDYGDPQKRLRSVPNLPERSYSGTNITQMKSHPIPFQPNFKTSTLKGSNSSVYSYPLGVINFNAKVNDENVTYSVPYSNKHYQVETNHNKRPSFARSTSVENNNVINDQNNENDSVMVVKFPLGNIKKENPPPMPPPRDPQRKIPTPLSYMYENTRPLSQNFDSSMQKNIYARIGECRSNVTTPNSYITQQNIYENTMASNHSNGLTWMKRPISTSEDHIAMQQSFTNSSKSHYQNEQPRRPSSVTAEVIRPEIYNRYLMRPQINNENSRIHNDRRHTQDIQTQDYLYFADKMPRSRKPIHITPNSLNIDGKNANVNPVGGQNSHSKPRNASEFWRMLDNQENQRKKLGHNRTLSDQSVNGTFVNNQSYQRRPQTLNYTNNNPIKSQVYNGNLDRKSDLRRAIIDTNKTELSRPTKIKTSEPICYSNIDIIPMDDVRKDSLRHQSSKSSDEDLTKTRRKSTNLEDALSELEAIYNSLGLGDEDLLERAEKRELMTPKTTESYPYSASMKDNYFRYPSLTSDLPKPNMNRRSSIPDKLHDDMAYRRMNPHERPKSKDVNNLVSQVSYMLSSPTGDSVDYVTRYPVDAIKSEPDVLFDDVVYRNIRQANNHLKIEDPQPPFGIPIGPITTAPLSDYLHATSDVKERTPTEVPDVVMDDLAYRSLRKDRNSIINGKEVEPNIATKGAIPPSTIFDNHVTKKKRAVRSLSANIFTLIQKEIDDALGLYNNRSGDKAQSIPDLPDAVVEFGKSGKLPDHPRERDMLDVKSAKIINDYSLKDGDSALKSSDRVYGRPPLTPEKSPRGPTPVGKMPYSPKKDLDDYFGGSYDTKPIERENPFKSEINKDENTNEKSPYKVSFENKFHSDIYLNSKNKIAMDSSVTLYSQVPKNIHIERQTSINNEHYNHKPAEKYFTYESTTETSEKADNEPPSDSKGKSTEDSLLEISNQLKKVEKKIKSNMEAQASFEEEGVKLKALAKKCDINLSENFKAHYPTSNNLYKNAPVETRHIPAESKHVPLEAKHTATESKYNPFEPSQSTTHDSKSIKMSEPIKIFSEKSILAPHIASVNEDLDKMPSFDDLRKGINELLDGISHVTDKFNLRRANELKENKKESPQERKESPIELSMTEDDADKSKDNRGSPEYNSSEELAMIFNLSKDDSCASSSKAVSAEELKENEDSHLELNSPKLVKTANQNYKKSADLAVPEPSKPSTSAIASDAPWRKQQREQQSTSDNGSKGTFDDDMSPSKSNTWYQDSEFLLFACFYTLAYTQQLAGLDILTLLGLVLATISIIAMLII